MKKSIITLFVAAAVSLSASAQNKIGDIVKSGEQYFIYITELGSPESNSEFQKNLAVIQSQNSAIRKMQDDLKAGASPENRAYNEALLQKMEKSYKENEKLMGQAYGFAPNRTYRQIYYKSNLCVMLTKDEMAELKMKDGTPVDPQKISNLTQFALYRIKEINGPKENEKLQMRMGEYFKKQAEVAKLRKQLAETKDALQQKSLGEKVAAGEKAIKEFDAKIRADYGLPAERNYAVEVANSRLYMLLNSEETKRVKDGIDKAKKAKSNK